MSDYEVTHSIEFRGIDPEKIETRHYFFHPLDRKYLLPWSNLDTVLNFSYTTVRHQLIASKDTFALYLYVDNPGMKRTFKIIDCVTAIAVAHDMYVYKPGGKVEQGEICKSRQAQWLFAGVNLLGSVLNGKPLNDLSQLPTEGAYSRPQLFDPPKN